MKLVEIASYPKSGNTWVRFLVKEFLAAAGASETRLPVSVHHAGDEIKTKASSVKIPGVNDEIAFYKSHVINNPLAKPDHILYVYRHPLDVFLSTLNFMNFKSDTMPPKRLQKIFIDGKPMGVEEIVQRGEMDFYFERFLVNLGSNYHRGMLQEKAHYFEHVRAGIAAPNSISFTYESLIDDANAVIVSVLSELLGVSFDGVKVDLESVDKQTKGSNRKSFFWQAKKGTRFDFLSEEQINTFEAKYKTQLASIGY